MYTAQPKQVLFHFAQADEVFYGGAAGGGKSEAIIWDAYDFCTSYKKVHASIFRRTYPELEKSIILRWMEKIPAKTYKYNKQEHRILFPETGSTLEFNHCQYESDVIRFQSAEYQRMYFDELTHFTEYQYKYLLSRCRTTNPEVKVQIKSASNPGGVGHLWVKKRFINDAVPNQTCDRVDLESGTPYTTIFIPAKVYDNDYLMKGDPNYVNKLNRLPEDERKALLEGDWNVFKGQFFKEWRTDLHIIDPFEIPTNWVRFRALDWGYRNPTAVLWFAIAPDGQMVCYKELYVIEKTDQEVCELIKEMDEDEIKRGIQIRYTVADPALWSVNQYEKGESLAMRFVSLGVPLMKADNNRMSGWSTMHSYLLPHEKDNKPSLQFFSTCHNAIRTIPSLVHDQHKPEDLDTEGEDHCADACRYGLMSHPLRPMMKKVESTVASFNNLLKKIRAKKHHSTYIGDM